MTAARQAHSGPPSAAHPRWSDFVLAAIEFKRVIDKVISQFKGDLALQNFEPVVLELDDLPGFDVD
jgi:hypothetical protein